MSSVLLASCFGIGVATGAGAYALSQRSKQAPANTEQVLVAVPANEPVASTSTALIKPTSREVLKFGYPGPISDLLHRCAVVCNLR